MEQELAIKLLEWILNNWFMVFLVGLKYLKEIAKNLFSIYTMIQGHETRIVALEKRHKIQSS